MQNHVTLWGWYDIDFASRSSLFVTHNKYLQDAVFVLDQSVYNYRILNVSLTWVHCMTLMLVNSLFDYVNSLISLRDRLTATILLLFTVCAL
jgi:hypothetical protein